MDTTSLLPFAAVLLAGGKSSRMGRDKAGVIVGGQPLWERQLATLRATGPQELFISGKPDGPYAATGLPIVLDALPDLGPLAGLAAALRYTSQDYLLVLAIDLPAMTAEFLQSMIQIAATKARGVVGQSEGWLEPLAAIYPRTCLPLAEACLRDEDRSLQRFGRLAVERGLIGIRELSESERSLFRNVNRPADL